MRQLVSEARRYDRGILQPAAVETVEAEGQAQIGVMCLVKMLRQVAEE